jgi:hypothetical protein
MTNVAATAGRELGGDIPSHLAFLAHRRPVPSNSDSLHSSECYCKSPLARSRWRALSSKCRVTLARLVHPFLGPVRPVSSGANKGIAQMPDQGILSLQSNLSLRVPLRCRELVSEVKAPSLNIQYSTVVHFQSYLQYQTLSRRFPCSRPHQIPCFATSHYDDPVSQSIIVRIIGKEEPEDGNHVRSRTFFTRASNRFVGPNQSCPNTIHTSTMKPQGRFCNSDHSGFRIHSVWQGVLKKGCTMDSKDQPTSDS